MPNDQLAKTAQRRIAMRNMRPDLPPWFVTLLPIALVLLAAFGILKGIAGNDSDTPENFSSQPVVTAAPAQRPGAATTTSVPDTGAPSVTVVVDPTDTLPGIDGIDRDVPKAAVVAARAKISEVFDDAVIETLLVESVSDTTVALTAVIDAGGASSSAKSVTVTLVDGLWVASL